MQPSNPCLFHAATRHLYFADYTPGADDVATLWITFADLALHGFHYGVYGQPTSSLWWQADSRAGGPASERAGLASRPAGSRQLWLEPG